jgi:uncharacterized protein HemX
VTARISVGSMGRWIATILACLLAAGAGLFIGYSHWGQQAARVEQRLTATSSELTNVREQKQQLEQRLEAISKEQERLAQENEILRKQRATESVLGGTGGELPAQPPK